MTVIAVWLVTETRLHINILELKAMFLTINDFQTHLQNKSVLLALHNGTVVSHFNKQRGFHSLNMSLMVWHLKA